MPTTLGIASDSRHDLSWLLTTSWQQASSRFSFVATDFQSVAIEIAETIALHSASAVELRQVGLTINGQRILDDINLSLPTGARAAIIGPNGCGKSTLLRILCGYWFPTDGAVRVLGETLGKTDVDSLRRRIGIVDPGGPFAPDARLTVLEIVQSGFFGHLCLDFDEPTAAQKERARETAEQVGLADRANHRFGVLSTGEQRRALLARALAPGPELLILDEPTAGLDLLARETLLATLDVCTRTWPDMTTLLVTHHLEELPAQLQHVILMAHGRIAEQGLPASVLTNDNLSRAFGCPVSVHCENGRWHWSVDPRIWPTLLEHSPRCC